MDIEQAIEKLKHHIEFTKEFPSGCFDKEIEIVLNYISELQKENEELKEQILNLNERIIIEKTKIPKQDNFYAYYNYVSKDKLTKLLQIDNIDVVHCKIKKLLEK